MNPTTILSRAVAVQAVPDQRLHSPVLLGVCRRTTGAARLSLTVLVLAPGERCAAQVHFEHELACYLIDGAVEVASGEHLEQRCGLSRGEFVYVPPGLPFQFCNSAATEARIVLAESDADPQGDCTAYPLPPPHLL